MSKFNHDWQLFDGLGNRELHESESERVARHSQLVSYQLLEEFLEWFNRIASAGIMFPKMFSAVDRHGLQLILNLAETPLDIGEHAAFMRFVLNRESCIAFVYKIRLGSFDERGEVSVKELHAFYSGERGHYFHVQVALHSNDKENMDFRRTCQIEYPDARDFHHNLLQEPYAPTAKENDFAKLWDEIRDTITWRKREQN